MKRCEVIAPHQLITTHTHTNTHAHTHTCAHIHKNIYTGITHIFTSPYTHTTFSVIPLDYISLNLFSSNDSELNQQTSTFLASWDGSYTWLPTVFFLVFCFCFFPCCCFLVLASASFRSCNYFFILCKQSEFFPLIS